MIIAGDDAPVARDPEFSRTLLAFVRDVVRAAVLRAAPPAPPDLPLLRERRGCFVSLHEHGRLRGCIGTFRSHAPLSESLPSMAAAAALSDPRFSPVRANELDELDIEVSLLTPPRHIDSLDEIRAGVDGIHVLGRHGESGCYLPQVATETGWNAHEFVRHCLREKAGLPEDAFDRGEATIEIFQAEIFPTP